MKRIFFLLSVVILTGISCKKNFLEVSSPSAVDEDFVFSSTGETYKVMVGLYEIWRGVTNGLHYAIDIPGSDAETHPEALPAQTRHIWETLFPPSRMMISQNLRAPGRAGTRLPTVQILLWRLSVKNRNTWTQLQQGRPMTGRNCMVKQPFSVLSPIFSLPVILVMYLILPPLSVQRDKRIAPNLYPVI